MQGGATATMNETTTTSSSGSGEHGWSPVDNETYNLLQALTSKLEAIEAYHKYEKDGGEGAQLFREMADEDRRHADKLLEALHRRLGR